MRTIFHNAVVVTMNPTQPLAGTVTVEKGRFVYVGGAPPDGLTRSTETRRIDCRGRILFPGLIDTHGHLSSLARRLALPDLSPENHVHGIKDLQAVISQEAGAVQPGQWIQAAGYHEYALAEKRHPTRRDLDQAAPDHPVKISHRTGLAHVLNSRALALAGINSETVDPDGGLVDLDPSTGEPTGVLFGFGKYLSTRIPPLSAEMFTAGLRRTNQILLSHGITGVHDTTAHNDLTTLRNFRRWLDTGALQIRLTAMIGYPAMEGMFTEETMALFNDVDFRWGGVKVMVEDTTGRLNPDQQTLNQIIRTIHTSGGRAVIHAVEPPALEAAIIALEKALERRPRRDHRHRIEHVAVCPPELIQRMATLEVIPVVQPAFILANGDRYLETVAKHYQPHLYPLAGLWNHSLFPAASSDFPVGPINPFMGIQAAESRKTSSGRSVSAHQAINRNQSLTMYTRAAAYAGFEERQKGMIAPGLLADMILLNEDPTRIPGPDLGQLRILATFIGGQLVWKDESGDNPAMDIVS